MVTWALGPAVGQYWVFMATCHPDCLQPALFFLPDLSLSGLWYTSIVLRSETRYFYTTLELIKMLKLQLLPCFWREKTNDDILNQISLWGWGCAELWQLSAAGWLFLALDGKLREVSIERDTSMSTSNFLLSWRKWEKKNPRLKLSADVRLQANLDFKSCFEKEKHLVLVCVTDQDLFRWFLGCSSGPIELICKPTLWHLTSALCCHPAGWEAAAAGLQPGQVILKVNGNNVNLSGYQDVLEHFSAQHTHQENPETVRRERLLDQRVHLEMSALVSAVLLGKYKNKLFKPRIDILQPLLLLYCFKAIRFPFILALYNSNPVCSDWFFFPVPLGLSHIRGHWGSWKEQICWWEGGEHFQTLSSGEWFRCGDQWH